MDAYIRISQGMLHAVPSSLPSSMTAGVRKAWSDVIGRSVMAATLILDTKRGMLDMMTESTYRTERGNRPEFGEEILGIARQLAG